MRLFKSIATAILITLAASNADAEVIHSNAISVYGDIKYPENFKHFDYVNPDAPKGGEIVLPDIGAFDNLNPYIRKGRSPTDINLLFDTLMANSEDEIATSYGLVAKSVEYPNSNEWIIFHLRNNAKFSDGSPITADDVVFSFNTLKDKGHPLYKIYYGEIAKAEKLGRYDVKFTFSNPENRQLKLIIGQLPILSKKYYDKVQFDKTTLTAPLGSGPYLVDKIVAGRTIVYKRNPNYWGKDLAVNKGKYNFDKIRHEYYLDTYVAIQAFKSGVVDLRYENIAKNWANSYNIDAVKTGRIIKEKIKHEIPTGMQAFAFNLRKPEFQDVRVREAIAQTLDFEWMNKNLFYGSYTRTNSYFSNSLFASSGLPEGKELEILEKYKDKLPAKLFTEEFKLPVSDASGRIRDRLIYAKNLLAEAGWKIKDGVLQNAKGEPFEIEFVIQQGSTFERLMPPLAANLSVLGIKTKIKEVDTSQYKKIMEDFDFDMCVASWGQSLAPGTEQMDYWHSSSADVKSSNNIVGVKNPVIDELVLKIIKAQDKETLVATTKALDRILLWNHFVIPNWYIDGFRLLYWNKFGRPEIMPKYDSNFGLYNWWRK